MGERPQKLMPRITGILTGNHNFYEKKCAFDLVFIGHRIFAKFKSISTTLHEPSFRHILDNVHKWKSCVANKSHEVSVSAGYGTI